MKDDSAIKVAIIRHETAANAKEVEWSQLQRQDNEIGAIITYLESGDLPIDKKHMRKMMFIGNQFTILDGTLYHTQPDGRLQLAVPTTVRNQLIREAHAGMFSGHLLEAKVYSQH